jgi:GT2 family glycosyltransferase
MTVSVIIVSYSRRDLLRQCLRSVADSQGFATGELEVIVVDNASADDSPEMVRAEFPPVRLVENERNVGFARAVNQGLRLSGGELSLLLNSDCQVEAGAIAALAEFMADNEDVALVCPMLVYPDGRVQPSGGPAPSLAELLASASGLDRLACRPVAGEEVNQTREIGQTSGACMMVRRRAWEAVGLLDEAFFMYWEDVDWCRRLATVGRLMYYPGARVAHVYGGSSSGAGTLTHLAALLSTVQYVRKWHGRAAAQLVRLLLLGRELASLIASPLVGWERARRSWRGVRLLVTLNREREGLGGAP